MRYGRGHVWVGARGNRGGPLSKPFARLGSAHYTLCRSSCHALAPTKSSSPELVMPPFQPSLTARSQPLGRKSERHGPTQAFICRLNRHGQAFFSSVKFRISILETREKKTNFPLTRTQRDREEPPGRRMNKDAGVPWPSRLSLCSKRKVNPLHRSLIASKWNVDRSACIYCIQKYCRQA